MLWSTANEACMRAGGDTARVSCVQFVPLHCQVSASAVPFADAPPKRTEAPFARPATAAPLRTDGPVPDVTSQVGPATSARAGTTSAAKPATTVERAAKQ